MARYTQAVCRLCRREGEKLFLKADRCYTDKCALERRKYPPGQHWQNRPKPSDYGLQLREKQKLKRIYGVLERQFRRYFEIASKKKGVTGEALMQLLETRLDNVVQRLGFATGIRSARQIVSHGHVLVNGRKVNIPSYNVKPGDIIEIKEKSKNLEVIKESLEKAQHRGIPSWLELDAQNMRGKVLRIPSREEIPVTAREQLVVELYSK
jgi:small subunit ribosomal protein S4